MSVAHDEFPMIQANCRARFTAADFDFVVRTLARSKTDHVSLVDLLSDVETRDSILDHPRLVDAILCNAGHLHISSQFYFYVLARHVLQQAGIVDRKLCDYVGSLLETFSRANSRGKKFPEANRHNRKVCDRQFQLAAKRAGRARKNKIATKYASDRRYTKSHRPGADDRESNRVFRHRSKDRPVKRGQFSNARACAQRNRNPRP